MHDPQVGPDIGLFSEQVLCLLCLLGKGNAEASDQMSNNCNLLEFVM